VRAGRTRYVAGDAPPDQIRMSQASQIVRSINLAATAQKIRETNAWDAKEAAFMGRMLVQATLPHRNPGKDVREYSRTNGNLTLTIQPGPRRGIPFGPYPRLILAWITTEAVQKKSREVSLGPSLSSFMGELGLIPSGGRWGTITRLRDQMERLFSSRIAVAYDGPEGYQLRSAEVATALDLWWDPKSPEQASVWESKVTLGEAFYAAITEAPVPLDMRVLREIKRSPLALDLYAWLTWRIGRLNRPLYLSWEQLHGQFGADYKHAKHFAAEARKEMRRLRVLWPELLYSTPKGRLVLHPGQSHLPPKAARS